MQMTTMKILTKHRYKNIFMLRGVSDAEQEEILDLVENRQILFFFKKLMAKMKKKIAYSESPIRNPNINYCSQDFGQSLHCSHRKRS